MSTLTVRLRDSGQSQEELLTKLGGMVRDACSAASAVEPVFPGDKGRYKNVFVVTVADHASALARILSELPGVEKAYVAPDRVPFERKRHA